MSNSSYITEEGAAKLQAELDHLWRVERPRITKEVQAAAAQGDRSENAEYIYGKRRLREIDRRLRFLSKRLDELTVVREPVQRDGRVRFGAWVALEDDEGEEVRYRLVGPDESDVAQGKISIDSPLGRALIGAREDDEINVRRPKGEKSYTLLSIDYEDEA